MTERYTIHGAYPAEYVRARDCIAQAYREAVALAPSGVGQLASPERFAEAVLARLGALDPPMLVVALDDAGDG